MTSPTIEKNNSEIVVSCLSLHQLSIHPGEAVEEAFVQEVAACDGVVGREVAEDDGSVLLVHGQDDAHGQLSNRRRAVLQSRSAELTTEAQTSS